MPRLTDVVRSLIKPKAGGVAGDTDRQATILGLNEFSAAQRQRSQMLISLLLVFLAAPFISALAKIPEGYLPYLFGGAGLFAAGTVKLLLDAFQDISRAHTLAIICQNLKSSDAREVLKAWIDPN